MRQSDTGVRERKGLQTFPSRTLPCYKVVGTARIHQRYNLFPGDNCAEARRVLLVQTMAQREEEIRRQLAENEQEEEERRIREQEMRARRREAERRRMEELRAEQLQAEQQARTQRLAAEEAEQQLLQRASRGSRAHSVLGETTPVHRVNEEMMRQEVRGRASEATYAPSQGTQFFSMAHEVDSSAEGHQRMMGAMAKPRYFDGTRPSSWISHMEYYLDSAGVHGEVARLRVAVSFLDCERMDWFTIALGDSQRPQTWTELKDVIRAHFNAISEGEAVEKLRRVRQIASVQEYLIRFNKAASECPNLREEEKTLAFVKNLRPEISDLVDVRRPRNMREAIEEAVRIEAVQAERQRGGRAPRWEFPSAPQRPQRADARRSMTRDLGWETRSPTYGRGPVGVQGNALKSWRPFAGGGTLGRPPPTGGRSSEGMGTQGVRPALVRETGVRTVPRRSQGVAFQVENAGRDKKEQGVRCFGCGQEGHYKVNCPNRSGN